MAAILPRSLRRVIAYLLAYALSLQGFVFAIASVSPAGASIQNPTFVALQLCSHSQTTTLPDAPTQAPLGQRHCLFCIAGAVYVNCASPSVCDCNFAFLSTPRLLGAPRLIARFVGGGAWPRGPPAVA
jgi:hypothetical protein